MFDGLEGLQRKTGLRIDARMEPGGPMRDSGEPDEHAINSRIRCRQDRLNLAHRALSSRLVTRRALTMSEAPWA